MEWQKLILKFGSPAWIRTTIKVRLAKSVSCGFQKGRNCPAGDETLAPAHYRLSSVPLAGSRISMRRYRAFLTVHRHRISYVRARFPQLHYWQCHARLCSSSTSRPERLFPASAATQASTRLRFIEPGSYELTVAAKGFKLCKRSGISENNTRVMAK